MFRFEVQFLGRVESDFARHVAKVRAVGQIGRVAFRTYYFAGIKGLIVLLESEADRDAILRAVPRSEIVGSWPIAAEIQQAA